MNILIIIVLCVISFILGSLGLYAVLGYLARHKVRIKNKAKDEMEKSIGTMNIILLIIGITLLVFTIAMIYIFCTFGMIPDTLVTCVFVALGGECGVMGWIKTTKDKYQDREWQLEDEEKMKEMEGKNNG